MEYYTPPRLQRCIVIFQIDVSNLLLCPESFTDGTCTGIIDSIGSNRSKEDIIVF